MKKKVNPTRVPIEAKESIRWLENLRQSTELLGEPSRCIHIGDRENDIFELFCSAQESGTRFLVRTCVHRLAGDGQHTIAATMRRIKVKATHEVEVRDAKGAVSRAIVKVKYQERIVVIEKPVEMNLDHRNSPRLEAYPRVGDRPEVTVSQLLCLTLRHRPDRIIVGEVKDSEAEYGLLQAMNTGHDGTFSTIHANTALSALNRLASLAMPGFGSLDLSRKETAAAIDLVIEVKRSVDGWRGVNSVLEVDDYDQHTRQFQAKEVYRRQAAQAAVA